jgi:hypothetical protein
MTTIPGSVHTIVLEQTKVTRYVALDETAGGFVIAQGGDRHLQEIEFPGVTDIASVIFYRTRHTRSPAFSVRINSTRLTEYAFTEADPLERCWHEIIPAGALKAQGNELTFAVPSGAPSQNSFTVTFGDVVIVYTSNETTIKIKVPLTLHP